MNLVLLFEDDFVSGGGDSEGGKVRLSGRRCEYNRENFAGAAFPGQHNPSA